uniref:G-protein coupled receptors family 1 profile domain-containing protein n=1 Tax=Saimiri boliviensis boliviensis TaxID=39432 RepID=A0A2K6V217_SAIBB
MDCILLLHYLYNRQEVSPVILGPAYNHTMETPASFILEGIPGLTRYIISLLGNTLIVTAIWMNSTLHEPIYCFLCVLAAVDMVMASSVVPNHSCGDRLLLAMAFDRYVAICKPLHYKRILTPQVMLGMSLIITIRAVTFMTPLSWMVSHLPFCGSNVVLHSYCEHLALARLVCTDPMPSSLYSLIGSSIMVGSDVALIAAFYVLILRLKALSTCGSHVGVTALYYLPGMASIYAVWLGQDVVPLHTRVLLSDLYLIIPATLNPVIYGMRTKQLLEGIWCYLMHFLFDHSNQGS